SADRCRTERTRRSAGTGAAVRRRSGQWSEDRRTPNRQAQDTRLPADRAANTEKTARPAAPFEPNYGPFLHRISELRYAIAARRRRARSRERRYIPRCACTARTEMASFRAFGGRVEPASALARSTRQTVETASEDAA